MMRDRSGFTLLEIMLAMLILGMVVAMVSAALSGSIKAVEATLDQGDVYYRAQVAMERISDDLASAVLPDDAEFVGGTEGNNGIVLAFASLSHLVFDTAHDQAGLARIRYAVQGDHDKPGQLVLLREDVLQRKKDSDEREAFLLCDRLRSVSFTFFNRNGEVLDTWDTAAEEEQERELPAAVACRLEFWVDEEQDLSLSFQTTVLLPAALIRPEEDDAAP
jgi:prepilin-type N-terminal cleavage/methylation domain-containing protein